MAASWSELRRERAEDRRYLEGIRRPDRAEEGLVEESGKVIRPPTKGKLAELRLERAARKRKRSVRVEALKLRMGRRVGRKASLAAAIKQAKYRRLRK